MLSGAAVFSRVINPSPEPVAQPSPELSWARRVAVVLISALMQQAQMASGAAAAVVTAHHATRVFQRGRQTARAALLARFRLAELEYGAGADTDLVYGFPPRDAMPSLLDAGFRKLGEMRRFALALRTGAFLRAKLGSAAGSVVSTGLDALRAAGLLAGAGRAAVDYRLETPAAVDERFDRLWETARGGFPFVGVRDAAFVGGRFAGGGVALAALAHRKTGALAGYAAIARDGADANLVDVFATREGLAPLLRLVAVRAARDGVEALSIRLCGAPALVTCLTLLGFREQADAAPVIVGLGAGQDPRGELTDVDTWYLTEADADL